MSAGLWFVFGFICCAVPSALLCLLRASQRDPVKQSTREFERLMRSFYE